MAQIADAIIATWRDMDAALTPIIGQQGVAALYKRSLYLTVSSHPWLAGMHEGVQTSMDLAALESVLLQQTHTSAASGGNALFQQFNELLASLVGRPLTERLLRSVWANSLSGPAAQDIAP